MNLSTNKYTTITERTTLTKKKDFFENLESTSVQINIQQLQNEQPLQIKRISLKMLG